MIRVKNMVCIEDWTTKFSKRKEIKNMLGTILTIIGALASVAGGVLTAKANNEKQSTMIANKVTQNLTKR